MKLSIFVCVVLLAAMFIGPAPTAAAAGPRCYVDKDSTGVLKDGSTWENAYLNPQEALANPSCTDIWIANGTYTPTSGTARGISFILKKGVALRGGFAGGESTLEPRDFVANETILSGDLNGDDGSAGNSENSLHVVNGGSADASALLEGVTIRGGNANGSGIDRYGGGMINANGDPVNLACGPILNRVIINGNRATSGGAGMYNLYCSPAISHFQIDHNQGPTYGGGMWNYESHPTLSDGSITYNAASINGGGLYGWHGSSFSITSVLVDHNTAGDGAGIWIDGGTGTTMSEVTLTNNQATTFGGGMFISGTDPVLDHLTFSLNTAASGAGAEFVQSSPLLTNSTFTNNTSSSTGGGLVIADSSSYGILHSVTFQNNHASNGGGILNTQGDLTLTDVSFSENTVTGSGGGILNDGGSLNLSRVNFTDNESQNGGGLTTSGGPAVTLTDVNFIHNQASGGGAGLNSSYTNLSLSGVTFYENGNGSVSPSSGGGMTNNNSGVTPNTVSVTNVTFYGNEASQGGAIYNYGPMDLRNATLAGNSGSYEGDGIFTQTPFNIDNTILWNGGTDELYNNDIGNVNIHDSVIQGGCPAGAACNANIVTADPGLGALKSNGGFSQTMALGVTSSAVDAGNNATCASTDQRGFLRPFDGNGDGTATCDIGAYEWHTFMTWMPFITR